MIFHINHHFPMVSHGFPIKDGDFLVPCVSLPEGTSYFWNGLWTGKSIQNMDDSAVNDI